MSTPSVPHPEADQSGPAAAAPLQAEWQALLPALLEKGAKEGAELLAGRPAAVAAGALGALNPALAQEILGEFSLEHRQKVQAAAPPEVRRQWMRNEAYPEETIGRMMEPPLALFGPGTSIAAATAELRQLTKAAFITYLWVVDGAGRLVGVVVMREMLLSENPQQRLEEIMIPNPFHLTPEMSLTAAMKETVVRHFPVYPVCDGEKRLVGLMRGQMLFEAQAIELSAQPGSMVGVEREERLGTPWARSLKFRHPWLQLNLLTAFIAAAVVGMFEHTLERVVLLAVFLPVLAGQSGNTGCQALAVALRGMTLGELKPGRERMLVLKEALLGVCNGAMVGVSAGLGMWVYATMQKHPEALTLGAIVFAAMTASCLVSGISGALIPMGLKKLGADPATASSIFLTTATDVASMGIFLGLATVLV